MPRLHVPVGVGKAVEGEVVVGVVDTRVDVADEVTPGLVELAEVGLDVANVVLDAEELGWLELTEVAVEVKNVVLDAEALTWLELPVRGGVKVGVTATVPRDGVAAQVATCSPIVREVKASGCSRSGTLSGTVPTYALKL